MEQLGIIRDGLKWGVMGALYGIVFSANPIMAATAFGASSVAKDVVRYLGYTVPRSRNFSKEVALTTSFLCHFGVEVLSIIAFKELRLIAKLGTILLSLNLLDRSISWLDEAKNKNLTFLLP
ncbi:MAG: hypothetical protein H0W88_05305 [Parachlamydiaceae bacterium]|nr:hypothetical protein [Parachlamydiaceae bacterium]